MIMKSFFSLFLFLMLICSTSINDAFAQNRLIQINIDKIEYQNGVVTLEVYMPKYKKRLKTGAAVSKIRTDMVSKIIDEGIEQTPYDRKFNIDKSVKLDELVRLIGADIEIYQLYFLGKNVYATCKFDIKYIEKKLMDNGYLKRFGI